MSQKRKKKKPFILYPCFPHFKYVETRLIYCPSFHLVGNTDGILTQVEHYLILGPRMATISTLAFLIPRT